jgi:hypothetical protein
MCYRQMSAYSYAVYYYCVTDIHHHHHLLPFKAISGLFTMRISFLDVPHYLLPLGLYSRRASEFVIHRFYVLLIASCSYQYLQLREWRLLLRHWATNRNVAGSIPDGVNGIFHWHNRFGRTMALGSTQPLTEMSTRNLSWGVKAACA